MLCFSKYATFTGYISNRIENRKGEGSSCLCLTHKYYKAYFCCILKQTCVLSPFIQIEYKIVQALNTILYTVPILLRDRIRHLHYLQGYQYHLNYARKCKNIIGKTMYSVVHWALCPAVHLYSHLKHCFVF